ncbi:MAG TPA: hypothetical protein VMU38_09095 [Candidatus Binatia bacterium]|nr:hypothetical protein [Candidatus Binatia bacterium]
MKRLLTFVAFAALTIAPCATQAQSAMSASTLGVGPHGWDYYIGTWSCSNSMPSAMSGPATQTLTVSRSAAGSGLFFRVTGTGFDGSGFVTYAAPSKTWMNPASLANGSYSYESTTQTGKKTVWTGTMFDASTGKTMQIRDTYTLSPSSYTDVTQYKSGAVWKTSYSATCTKS